ncbi:universal stress protein [Rhizorhabdus dicambivorans]|uniref:Universal stress protein UspA n=1 Tax=Rhizorhabdus dicambivorans TaxID=1850238 RepID=A0A2A4FV68_9SPHN|nr:universal stress protein [Rhizorhabdus dicambivorans]ATE67155.1 universal stress protein UspA [Rhizorhabdus dicambivorans]PCE41576.1 universal stress protein UspA [Rhizorhabdus dicambivorans]
MKNILLLVHDDAGQEARLQAALDITRALDGHLSCIDVAALPAIVGDYYSGAADAMLLADERDRESANKKAVTARLAHEDVPWDWADVTGTIAESVVAAAALADIIVLNRQLDAFPYPDMRDIASRILMHARKPVIAVPDSLERLPLDRALIAWDGQASCVATMRAAVPLLAIAKEVEIFMARDRRECTEPTEAAEYLSRHGIHAAVRIIDDGLHAADRMIAEEAERWRADYIVMGAYSHGRMMESFGGVTKRMLSKSRFPLVLGH